MKRSTFITTESFQVISYGNGLCYGFNNLRERRTVFFQDDDASQYRDELEAYVDKYHIYEIALSKLWYEYENISVPYDD